MEGSRFARWQLYGSAAGGSRERLMVSPCPNANLDRAWQDKHS
jgi:hypothetical protein